LVYPEIKGTKVAFVKQIQRLQDLYFNFSESIVLINPLIKFQLLLLLKVIWNKKEILFKWITNLVVKSISYYYIYILNIRYLIFNL
jgi:hypothetical protein